MKLDSAGPPASFLRDETLSLPSGLCPELGAWTPGIQSLGEERMCPRGLVPRRAGTQPVVHVACRVGEAGKWVLGRKVFWDRLRLSKEEVRCFQLVSASWTVTPYVVVTT